VRLTDFWERMSAHFGAAYADSVARDQVIAELGGRTVYQAIEQGVDTKDIWRAVCARFEVPTSHR
jgi:hypothetical protein